VLPGEAPLDYVARVTRAKLDSAQQTMILRQLPHRPLLSADTTVVVDDLILGKPADRGSRAHDQPALRPHPPGLTSVAVGVTQGVETQIWQIVQQSDVSFAALSDEAIAAYCNTVEPLRQGRCLRHPGPGLGLHQHIVGSHSGIMGLPLFETAQLLQQAGVRIL
jgi:septum formation protein